MSEPIWSKQIQHKVNIGTDSTAKWVTMTELLTFTPTQDKQEYSPSYIEKAISPKWKVGGTYSIETEADAMVDNELHAFFMLHEHDDNTEVEVVRVKTYKGTADSYEAEKAKFSMNVSPLGLTANEPVKISATFDMVSNEWEEGTWNETTPAFTPAAG